MFPYKLVATDLDGTLLRPDDTVSERTREALAAATAAGAAHIVVTGRSVAWTRHVLDDLGYEGIAVCGQGAQVYHAGEQRLLTSLTMDRRLAVLAIEKIEAETGPLHLAAARDGLHGEVLVGPGYQVQDGPSPRSPPPTGTACGPSRSARSTSSTPPWTTTSWPPPRCASPVTWSVS
ncbi:HAD family hydrolase [Actinomadura keratinilytica]